MANSIAIIGAGPTALYLLKALIEADRPLTITLFEAASLAGTGTPYSPENTAPSMLSNICALELPPVAEGLMDWLAREPAPMLRLYGVDPARVDERSFLPRLVLGNYFRSQLDQIVAQGTEAGHTIRILENTPIRDVIPDAGGVMIRPVKGADLIVDHVVIATGHQSLGESALPSPYDPLSATGQRFGVLGTSLSGIDAVFRIASQHGTLTEDRYTPNTKGLHITMMSRKGILPEADFYCPIPYTPLTLFTRERITAEIAWGSEGLLYRLYALMLQELQIADPAWVRSFAPPAADPEGFAARYWNLRSAAPAFEHASADLATAIRNARLQVTIQWRYTLLRIHEVFETAVRHLTPEDHATFDASLKAVFIDIYAAVPHDSIRRLLALHEAGVLDILALGSDFDLDGTTVKTGDTEIIFDAIIDARGQRALSAADIRFPSLQAIATRNDDQRVHIDDNFRLADQSLNHRVSFAALPFLLHDRPFIQGLTACAEIGETIARSLQSANHNLKDREIGMLRSMSPSTTENSVR